MMTTAVLSVVAVREPDPVEYVDIECQPAAISVDCNNVQTCTAEAESPAPQRG